MEQKGARGKQEWFQCAAELIGKQQAACICFLTACHAYTTTPCKEASGTSAAPGASHCISTEKKTRRPGDVRRMENGAVAVRAVNVDTTRVRDERSAWQ